MRQDFRARRPVGGVRIRCRLRRLKSVPFILLRCPRSPLWAVETVAAGQNRVDNKAHRPGRRLCVCGPPSAARGASSQKLGESSQAAEMGRSRLNGAPAVRLRRRSRRRRRRRGGRGARLRRRPVPAPWEPHGTQQQQQQQKEGGRGRRAAPGPDYTAAVD